MPYKIIDECFLQRPDRAWTAEEVAAWIETTRPTAYRHLNKLISLGLSKDAELLMADLQQVHFTCVRISKKGWQKIETEIELILEQYKNNKTDI